MSSIHELSSKVQDKHSYVLVNAAIAALVLVEPVLRHNTFKCQTRLT